MYIKKEDVERARQVNLLDYLPENQLEKFGSTGYRLAADHSLKINKEGLWYWWTNNIGGHNALDYMIQVEGYSFQDAVLKLLDGDVAYTRTAVQQQPKTKSEFNLPEKNRSNEKVRNYLISKRELEPVIVDYCMDKGLIYESQKYNNAVFVGLNSENKPAYAFLRGTMENSTYKGEVAGSNKKYGFSLSFPGNKTVHIFEAAIDALSYASYLSLMYNCGSDNDKEFWKKTNYLSAGGIFKVTDELPEAIDEYIAGHPEIKSISLHYDSDEKGIEAAESTKELLNKKYPDIAVSYNKSELALEKTTAKDWNDFLAAYRKECGYLPAQALTVPGHSDTSEYVIEITETVTKKIKVTASTEENAINIAREKYKTGGCTVKPADPDVSFRCIKSGKSAAAVEPENTYRKPYKR